MNLKVITPERVVLDTQVDAVYADAEDGQIGILPGHIPLISALKIGVLRYVSQTKSDAVAVMGGLLKTDGREVVILSDDAELGSDIDVARADIAKRRAEERLQERAEHVDVNRAQRALARSLARLSAAGRS